MYFSINPRNRTGARLYNLMSDRFLCANAASQIGADPYDYKPSDLEHLSRVVFGDWRRGVLNNGAPPWDCILICGAPARLAAAALHSPFPAPIAYMPHPVARRNTTVLFDRVREYFRARAFLPIADFAAM